MKLKRNTAIEEEFLTVQEKEIITSALELQITMIDDRIKYNKKYKHIKSFDDLIKRLKKESIQLKQIWVKIKKTT